MAVKHLRLTALCGCLLLAVGLRHRRQSRNRGKMVASKTANTTWSQQAVLTDALLSRRSHKALIVDQKKFRGERQYCTYPNNAHCAPEDVVSMMETSQEGFFDVFPGGDTGCVDGSDYYFTVRVKDPTKLHIHFQGGGACWGIVDPPLFGGEPADLLDGCHEFVKDQTQTGAFAFTDPENVWKDYSTVVVNYCSGDIHSGHAEHPWGERPGDGGGWFGRRRTPQPRNTVNLRGRNNAYAALMYAKDNFPDVASLSVTGSSAGSLALFMWGPWVLREFGADQSGKDVVVIADSFVPVMFPPSMNAPMQKILFDLWGLCDELLLSDAQISKCASGELTLQELFAATMAAYKNVRFAHINSKSDIVQYFFQIMLAEDFENDVGAKMTWGEFYKEMALYQQESVADNFWSYLTGGLVHMFVPTDDLTKATSDGVKLSDWIAQLVDPAQANPSQRVCDGPLKEVSRDSPVGSQETDYCIAY